MKANAQRSDGLGIPEEVIALEDGTFIDEMQWDEPIDSATEEAIASPKFDSDSVSQSDLELEQEEAVSQQPSLHENSTETLAESATSNDLSDREAVREEVQNESLDTHQDTTLPSPALDQEANALPDATLKAQQPSSGDLSVLDTEDAQRLEPGNVDIDVHQPEAFNPEQPDHEKKKESNSQE
jgi:hypothetical protein